MGASECGAVVRVEFRVRDIVKTRAQQGDDIQATVPLAVPEQLAHHPFRSVPGHGSSMAPRCDDTEPVAVETVRVTEKCQESTPRPATPLLNDQKLRTPSDPLTPCQRPIHRSGGVEIQPRSANAMVYDETVSRFRPFRRRLLST